MRNVPIDAFPDVTPAQVNIYTESPGLAAEDVEQLLTYPVESAHGRPAEGAGNPLGQPVRAVLCRASTSKTTWTSTSRASWSTSGLQEIGDRLPEGYGKPSMGPNTSGLGQVFWYTVERAPGVTKEQVTDMDLRTLAGLDACA